MGHKFTGHQQIEESDVVAGIEQQEQEDETESSEVEPRVIEAALLDLFDNASTSDEPIEGMPRIIRCTTFEEAHVLTNDRGVMLKVESDQDVYLTIQIQPSRRY